MVYEEMEKRLYAFLVRLPDGRMKRFYADRSGEREDLERYLFTADRSGEGFQIEEMPQEVIRVAFPMFKVSK